MYFLENLNTLYQLKAIHDTQYNSHIWEGNVKYPRAVLRSLADVTSGLIFKPSKSSLLTQLTVSGEPDSVSDVVFA